MNTEHQNERARAQSNLDNLRADLARYTQQRDQANAIIELRTADIERAERHLQRCQFPVYDSHGGVARRITCVDKHYIYLRNDVGRSFTFRRSDGAPKRTKRSLANYHGTIDDNRAVLLWNDYVAEQRAEAAGQVHAPRNVFNEVFGKESIFNQLGIKS